MQGFPGSAVVKNLPGNAGNTGLSPGSGRSPGGGSGNPLQYSCLENPMDRGAWQVTALGVTKSGTQLSSRHGHQQRPGGPRAKVLSPHPWELGYVPSWHICVFPARKPPKFLSSKFHWDLITSLVHD